MTIPGGTGQTRYTLQTGVRLNLPPGTACRIAPRSSTFLKTGLIVYEGIIDPGYQGELQIFVQNPTDESVEIVNGQRLAQVLFFPVVSPVFEHVESMPDTPRGECGFGSTGS